ncbi:hypothetical protein GQ600_13144 [Phytophthora cactorum]|nr:hypothetical protein GQ600_13144 [Phytophthora cactorum]
MPLSAAKQALWSFCAVIPAFLPKLSTKLTSKWLPGPTVKS